MSIESHSYGCVAALEAAPVMAHKKLGAGVTYGRAHHRVKLKNFR